MHLFSRMWYLSYLGIQRKLNPKTPSDFKSYKIISYLTEESAVQVEMGSLNRLKIVKGNIQGESRFSNKRPWPCKLGVS